jgi:hypothetical protein
MTDDLHDLDERLKKSAEEFSLTPSADVWKNVEAELHGRRRKRGFIFAAVLVCGTAFAWIWHIASDQEISRHNAQQNTSATPKTADGKGYIDNSITTASVPNSSATNNSFEEMRAEQSHAMEESPLVMQENRKAEGAQDNHEALTPNNLRNDRYENRKSPHDDVTADPHSPETITQSPLETEQTPPLSSDSATDQVAIVSPASDTDDVKPVDTIHVVKADSVSRIERTMDVEERGLPPVDSVPESSAGRFSIAFGAGPSYGMTKFKEKGDYHYIADYRNSTERDLPAMNFHIDFGYMFRYTYVYSGLHLVNYRTEMPNRQVVYDYDFGSSTGPVTPPVVVTRDYYDINNDAYGTTTTKLTYLEIPIGVRIKGYTYRRFSAWFQFELSATRLIKAQGDMYEYSSQEYRKIQTTDLKLWDWTLGSGVHVQYKVNDRYALAFGYLMVSPRDFYKSGYPISQTAGRITAQLSFHYTF